MSEKQKKGESRRMSENPRGRNKKSREEIRREIREFIRLNNITDPDLLAALAEELEYGMRQTRTMKGR